MFGLGHQELVILLVILLIVLVPVLAITMMAKRRNADAAGPEGFGGWLYLVGFGLVIAPLFILWNFVQELSKGLLAIDWRALTQADFVGTVWVYGILIAIVFGAVAAWWVYLAVLFFRKRRRFPRTWIATAFTLVGLDVVAGLVVGFQSSELGNTAREIIAAIIWTSYLTRSKRVANTFVK